MKKGILKKSILIFFVVALFAFAAAAEEQPMPAPVFSLESGVYEKPAMLYISSDGGTIYYTTNGDIPTLSSERYSGGIKLEGEMITPREVQRRKPQEESPRAITIRAAAADGTGKMGEIATKTYFIGTDALELYGLPMVNLVADTKDLWDPEVGIYTNYDYEHNIPAYFQYFNADGTAGPSRGVEIKVSGHGSRSNPKKSLRVYFNKGDTSNGKTLKYDIIPDSRANFYDPTHITTFSKLTFRISDWEGSDLRDPLAQKIGAFTRADVAAGTPTAVFLNGEFWGIYTCREQFDGGFVDNHYGIDKDNIVFFDRDWTLEPQETTLENGETYIDKIEYDGPADDNAEGVLGESYYRNQWIETRAIAESGDIADPAVYAEFCERVDIDNFIDFVITYIYAANDDWPGNNFKFWRVTEEAKDPEVYGADGKWRFMIHDFDIAFENPWHETLFLSALHDGSWNSTDEVRHAEFSTKLLGSLLKNETFRNEFAQRTLAYLSTAMSGANVGRLIDELASERQGAKLRDMLRWSMGWGPVERKMENWERNLTWARMFAVMRPESLRNHYMETLNENYDAGITGVARIAYYTPAVGTLSINGAEVSPERFGDTVFFSGEQFAGLPLRLSAYNNGEPMNITVLSGGVSTIYTGEATFTPEAGAGYTVFISQ
ncbi:MAG: CotH kinase family protein [Oscillospiraceae bacterium]|nr:CotH kinase family protein [Oscillospiraceae bacterium]